MVGNDTMGPSLQLIGARFSNFLLRKLSREFKLRGTSIFHEFQMAIFPYCFKLRSHGQVSGSPICRPTAHADMTLT